MLALLILVARFSFQNHLNVLNPRCKITQNILKSLYTAIGVIDLFCILYRIVTVDVDDFHDISTIIYQFIRCIIYATIIYNILYYTLYFLIHCGWNQGANILFADVICLCTLQSVTFIENHDINHIISLILYSIFIAICIVLMLISLLLILTNSESILNQFNSFLLLLSYFKRSLSHSMCFSNIKFHYHPSSLTYHTQYIFIVLFSIYSINHLFRLTLSAVSVLLYYKLLILYYIFIGSSLILLLNIVHIIRDLINRDLYNWLRCDYWYRVPNSNLAQEYIDLYSYFSKWSAYCIDKRVHNTECIICWNDFDFDLNDRLQLNEIKLLQCGHVFHEDCIGNNELKRWGIGTSSAALNLYPFSKCPTCLSAYDVHLEKWDYNRWYWRECSVWFNEEWPEYGQTYLYHNLWKQKDHYYHLRRKLVRDKARIKM